MSKVDKKPRNTKQLQVVWAAIKDDNSHPTADQVYDKVRESLPNVSLGTVYRNLQKLVANEKLRVLMLDGRSISILSSSAISISSVKSAAGYSMSWSTRRTRLGRLDYRTEDSRSRPIKPLSMAPASIARGRQMSFQYNVRGSFTLLN